MSAAPLPGVGIGYSRIAAVAAGVGRAEITSGPTRAASTTTTDTPRRLAVVIRNLLSAALVVIMSDPSPQR
ncbi:MAG: hypothetical protein LC708_04380, partial [Actinobacteria bacterium]|nr:hypothetical protein [Actinomycetota bacterium]